jgi:anti-sigma factor RsiW
MDQDIAKEETIRQYLLGTLSEPELSEIEEELFFDEELSRTADLIEDEIIEQYLDEELDARTRKAVETHFLRPPAHRQKLDFARLLRRRFESPGPSNLSAARESSAPLPPPPGSLFALVRSYGPLVAAAVFGASSLYLGVVLQEANFQIRSLKEQVQKQNDSQTPSISLSIKHGLTRGHSSLPQIAVPSTARTIKVDLLLPGRFAESFDVRLLDRRHDEEQIWSEKGVKPEPKQPRLTFNMPTQGIRTSTYDIVVSDPASGSSVTYPFDVSINQSLRNER